VHGGGPGARPFEVDDRAGLTPGSSFLAATAAAIGAFPVAGVAQLLGADRIMDSMPVVVNVLGNCVATFVVAKWEGQLDTDRMRRALSGDAELQDDVDLDAPTGEKATPTPQQVEPGARSLTSRSRPSCRHPPSRRRRDE
jgi:aerobic C4-dicarboxylate transport protein